MFALALAFVLDRRDTASRAFSLARGRLRISPLPREVLADLALAGFPAPDFASGFLGFLLRRESWRMRMVTAAVTYFGGGMALFFMWGARSADYQFVPLAIMAYAQGQLLLLLAYPYETLRWSGSAALRAMMSMTRTVPGRLSDAERAAENARAISSGVNDAWARTWRFLMIVVPGVLVGLALLGGSVSGWGVLQRVVAWQVAGATLAWRYGVILRKEYQDDFLILTRMAEALLRSPEEFLLDRGTIQRRRAD